MSGVLGAFIHHINRALVKSGAGKLDGDCLAELLSEAEDIDRRIADLEERIKKIENGEIDLALEADTSSASADVEDLRMDLENLEARVDDLESEAG